jgi:DNA-binding NarL/FixJ family response regulator
MQTSRVILANKPRLLRGMLRRAIGRADGLQIVGEVADPAKLSALLNQTEAQWVIVSIWPDKLLPSTVRSLLASHSSLCILGIAADGSQAKIACGDFTQETRDELSLDELIAILNKRR